MVAAWPLVVMIASMAVAFASPDARPILRIRTLSGVRFFLRSMMPLMGLIVGPAVKSRVVAMSIAAPIVMTGRPSGHVQIAFWPAVPLVRLVVVPVILSTPICCLRLVSFIVVPILPSPSIVVGCVIPSTDQGIIADILHISTNGYFKHESSFNEATKRVGSNKIICGSGDNGS